MAPLTLTPSADISALTTPELRQLIELAEQQQRELTERIAQTRYLLASLTAQERHQVTMEKLSNPAVITDLLADPSYEQDHNFSPSAVDTERENSYNTRKAALLRLDYDLNTFTREVNFLQSLAKTGPARVAELQGIIATTGGINNWFTGARDRAQQDLSALQANLTAIEPRLAAAQAALSRAQQRQADSTLKPNVPYDFDLHTPEDAVISQRGNQAVLLSFEIADDGAAMIALELPAGPDELDFTQSLSFRLTEYEEIEDFAALIGRDLRVYGGIFDTVGENLDREYDFESQLLPFPLEVVDIDGIKRYRLPQVVMERFVNSVVA